MEGFVDDMDAREWEYSRVYAQIDLDAIGHNLEEISLRTGPRAKVLAVVKCDGYGHGSVPVARAIEKLDTVGGFATATAEEALELRRADIQKPILILGHTFPYAYEELIRQEVRLTVFREDILGSLEDAARRVGSRALVHVKVDTGMGRIGIQPVEKNVDFLRRIVASEYLELEGIFTHFAKADERELSYTRHQLESFNDFLTLTQEQLGLKIPCRHAANSAGILRMEEAHLDLVRAGIILYGLYPSEEMAGEADWLRPALSLHSHLVYVKEISPGQSISYGGTFTAEKRMRVGTVPVGYGDGYPRSLSGRGYVLIRGKRAPILGRVCMDQFMVDLSDLPEAAEGEPVVLIGRDGQEEITAGELGNLSGRFNYELMCDLSPRVPRVYLRGGHLVR
ncbi:MAG: alanine racemase [bacterium]|nr:alanine racemase [bacterium]